MDTNKEDLKNVIYASKTNDKFDPILASKKIEQILKSPYGRNILAVQMREQIMREMLYEGKARLMLDAYYLSQIEEASFDCDIDVPAAQLSVNGLPIISDVKSDRVRIDTNVISSLFIVKWNEQNIRKFDMMELARRRGAASVQLQEDAKFYSLLDYAAGLTNQSPVLSLAGTSAANNNPSSFNTFEPDKVGPIDVAKAIGKLRGKMLPTGCIWINPERLTDFLLFNVSLAAKGEGGYGIFAPAIQEEALRTGLIGEIFGVPMYDSIVVPLDEIFVLAPKEYLGKMAIRTDIEVRFLSDANKSGDVFNIWEDIGMLIRYAKGIVKITIA
jgi:hypothetical protein